MAETQPHAPAPKALKRKRPSLLGIDCPTPEEKEARIGALTGEIEGLMRCYGEVMGQKLGLEAMSGGCGSLNGQIARLMEESDLPLSALVEQIHGRLKERNEGLTVASVKSGLLLVGQRLMYGVPNPDADVLEDHSSSSLWCWETREVKLLPKAAQGAIKIRRTCRGKIHERISAVSDVLSALQKPDIDQNYKTDLVKASEKLAKALAEADIRALVDRLTERNVANKAKKEAKRGEKACIKELERSKKKAEKEQKRMERELQKEKLKADKELKRLQEEAEKEEKRREREENELSKQLRKQQEEIERDQRRREREEAELKQQLSVQKQASIMERFLKKAKTSPSSPNQQSTNGTGTWDKKNETVVHGAVTCAMDCALSSNLEINAEDILKSHLSSWRHVGHLIRSNKEQHWSLRRKPKTALIKELKLTTSTDRGLVQDDELNIEKLVDECKETVSDKDLNTTGSHPDAEQYKRQRQLLQFDKSHRPAFYGIWTKNSNIVGPRHPFSKDPELDYDIDSDEEWEEEDPGESLSDCDKDDESLEENCSKADEEDESEDGFFVPDGYLSENEGVQVDRMETDPAEVRTTSCEQEVESEDLLVLLRQQKYLHSVTEHALRKNQPLIISNLKHEKSLQSNPEDFSGTAKLEIMCLQALCIRMFSGDTAPDVWISNDLDEEEEDCPARNKNSKQPPVNVIAVSDSDLPTIFQVSTIRSCPLGINKVVERLQQKFPAISRSQLRSKVREISDFVDNRWQVKKEVLDKLGPSISPERAGGRTKSIAAFFSKRCLPPAAKSLSSDNISS
ncbi:chromatin assembly factor 1 subunit FAS1 isoform X1 [Punica granatum]|uniref:Chromatin assembly factor 1 subunit FAS1 isoform X1 n=1 Tax=Punica granatum TaxID=22663 RepID=A0A6P8CGQ5_PUNGR|nr:chromatin assembly factor 1 subunit FAS1 isoform X1 [Punica granatum]